MSSYLSSDGHVLVDFHQVKNELWLDPRFFPPLTTIVSSRLWHFCSRFTTTLNTTYSFIRYGIYHVVNMFFSSLRQVECLIFFPVCILYISCVRGSWDCLVRFESPSYCRCYKFSVVAFHFRQVKTKDGKHSHETNYGLLSKRYNVDELVLFVPVKIWFGDSFVNSRGCEGAQREGNEGDMGTT